MWFFFLVFRTIGSLKKRKTCQLNTCKSYCTRIERDESENDIRAFYSDF